MEIKSFQEFNEKDSLSNSEILKIAKRVIKNSEISDFLTECKEGVHTQIQIQSTESVKSYLGIATNGGDPFSEVFNVSDARIALLGIVIMNTRMTKATEILNVISITSHALEYIVFPGNKKLSDSELQSRYNLNKEEYKEFRSRGMGTPISKTT